ncbi:permease of the major facilitator superfamily [Lactococcus cremoris subsp. cremoris SK11]|uniref:Permease of the major facilitator superfamily n=2 Tax=Lactococcus lactis subsp. cremoris TaxID=1359 RepID=Q02WX4_LACLS|nr:MFS transporter [Lactococcus cremoris]ABJ73548.1 permease of the major facilitator superfamily [Lactococcus cremoris subsp. cremoris SK11]ARE24160.2 MFS transporter [Lactococcus cremoris]KZK44226.1 transmembrane efflux protein [Lactococcus cremoris]KZK51165.1 transmembrane efflux protein [Lactococcus cremoris]MCT4409257.1 MFS transporter [Lactococcus cremoris]
MKNKKTFGLVLFIILFSYFLILMDNSIIFTSTVKTSQDLNMNEASLSWVSNAYTITFGGFLLLAGRLGDLMGRKIIFVSGLFIFGLSSLAVGLSTSTEMIIARAVQGIGSAIIAPTSLALLMDSYQGNLRMKAISYYGATAGIGSSFGLILGGWLTSAISWRVGFLLNVPFSLLLIVLTLAKVQQNEIKPSKIDFLGSLLSVIISVLFVYGITISNLLIIVASLILILVFLLWEKRITYALIPLELFKNRNRTGSYIARFTFMMAMLTYWFILPQIMQKMYNFSPLESGLAFLPLTLVNFIAALFLPKLTKALGNSKVMILGQVILLTGMFLSFISQPEWGYFYAMAFQMMIIGLGQGWLLAPLTAAGVAGVPPELSGAASGLTNMMHQLGGPVGLSIVVLFSSSVIDLSAYYHLIMAFITVFLLIGFLVLIFTNPVNEK